MRGQVDLPTFQRFCMAIDRCFLPESPLLGSKPGAIDVPEEAGLNLAACGLVAPSNSRGELRSGNEIYMMTKFGREFCRLVVSTGRLVGLTSQPIGLVGGGCGFEEAG